MHLQVKYHPQPETIQRNKGAHQYISPWSLQQNRVLDDLLFYCLDLSVLAEWFRWNRLDSTYRYFLGGAISTQMPPLVALEATPFIALLLLLLVPRVYVHGLSRPSIHFHRY